MRVDAAPAQDFRERLVERFQCPPAAVKKIEPPRVQVPTRRHARQAADIVRIKRDCPFREADRIRRMYVRAAVTLQRSAIERIEHDEDYAHGVLPGDVGDDASIIDRF